MMTGSVRRWAAGVGLAGGAVVAAGIIGAAGAPAAHADDGSLATDIGLLNAAGSNIEAAFNLSGQTDAVFPHLINQLEAIQTPLLSSDNSVVSAWGDFLFNGPDQQLAQATDAFLSAGEAYAADPSSTTALGELSPFLQFIDSLFFDTLPANVIGGLTDRVLGYDIATAGPAADLATSASPTPDEEISQTISELNQTTAILEAAPTTDLGTRSADLLTGAEALPAQFDPILTQFGSLQDELNPTDQTLLAYVDELMVSSAQNLVSADQAFVAADEAGDLSGNGVAPADLAVIGGALNFLDSFLTADGASLFAVLAGGLDVSSAADLASSLDPSATMDPSIFADLLSSVGL